MYYINNNCRVLSKLVGRIIIFITVYGRYAFTVRLFYADQEAAYSIRRVYLRKMNFDFIQ